MLNPDVESSLLSQKQLSLCDSESTGSVRYRRESPSRCQSKHSRGSGQHCGDRRFGAGRRGQLSRRQEGSVRSTFLLRGRNAGSGGASQQVGSTSGIHCQVGQEGRKYRRSVWHSAEGSEKIGAFFLHLETGRWLAKVLQQLRTDFAIHSRGWTLAY